MKTVSKVLLLIAVMAMAIGFFGGMAAVLMGNRDLAMYGVPVFIAGIVVMVLAAAIAEIFGDEEK